MSQQLAIDPNNPTIANTLKPVLQSANQIYQIGRQFVVINLDNVSNGDRAQAQALAIARLVIRGYAMYASPLAFAIGGASCVLMPEGFTKEMTEKIRHNVMIERVWESVSANPSTAFKLAGVLIPAHYFLQNVPILGSALNLIALPIASYGGAETIKPIFDQEMRRVTKTLEGKQD